MRKELVFLLEELSAKALLEVLLPRFLDPSIIPRFVPFEGKQDLDKQLERKLRGYQNPHARFIVLRDQDSFADCRRLKDTLLAKCQAAGRDAVTLVRIACHELETFYLADLAAVEKALQLRGLSQQQAVAKYRTPDTLGSPSHELSLLTKKSYQKVGDSRRIGAYLDIENARSVSFKNLMIGIRRWEKELLSL
jgi:hypothetical protein